MTGWQSEEGQTTGGLDGTLNTGPDACVHILRVILGQLPCLDFQPSRAGTIPLCLCNASCSPMQWSSQSVDLACWILGGASANCNSKERLKMLKKWKLDCTGLRQSLFNMPLCLCSTAQLWISRIRNGKLYSARLSKNLLQQRKHERVKSKHLPCLPLW